MAAPKKNPKPDPRKYLPLILVGAALVILAAALAPAKKAISVPRKVITAREREQEKANDHLRRTAEIIELQQRQMDLRNWELIHNYSQSVAEKAYAPPKEGAELIEQNNSEMVAHDLGINPERDEAVSPADLVRHQVADAQKAKQAGEAARAEYARRYIENARRDGWDVRLDDDYRVIGVHPIRAPSGR